MLIRCRDVFLLYALLIDGIMVQMGRVDGVALQGNKKEATYTWTDVLERNPKPYSVLGQINLFLFFIILFLLYTFFLSLW